MANTLIYSTVTNGDLLLFGNTLGLSKANNTLTPGTLDSIGTFITMDGSKTAPGGWGPNTTLLWQENSSDAIVTLDSGEVIVKAYLFWGGSYSVVGQNLTTAIATYPVTLVNPEGVKTTVTVDGSKINSNVYFEGTTAGFYSNYADVTSLVTLPGQYICEGVPATLSATENNYNAAGWNLAIVTSDKTKPWSIVSIVHSNDSAGSAGYSVPIVTPKSGTVTGYFTSSALDGDMTKGDSMYIGPYLSGPINPIGNFFNSQIENGTGGSIDTTGLYGTSNPVLSSNSNIVGGRQGFDTIRIPYPPGIAAGSTTVSGDILYTYANPATRDDMEVLMYGFQFLASNATPSLVKTVNLGNATPGTILTYTLVASLTGTSTVGNAKITDLTPPGTTFVTGSVIQDGVSKPALDLNTGLTIGTITLPYTTTISYKVIINSSTTDPVVNDYQMTYTNALSNNTIFTNTIVSNAVVTTIPSVPLLSPTKSVDPTYASINDVLTYTINFTNSGLDTATNVMFIDTLPVATTLVPNSVVVNGVTTNITGTTLSITLPDLAVGGTDTIVFKVNVTTIPSTNPINNVANTIYSYTNPTGSGTLSNLTNVVATTVSYVSLTSTKAVNKGYADVNNTLIYTIVLKNTGNTSANTISFIDTIPSEATFIPNSVSINGTNVSGLNPNPPGFLVPSPYTPLAAGGTLTISFSAVVNTIPIVNPILNSATTTLSYTVSPSVPNGYINSANSNIVPTTVLSASLSGVTKTTDKSFASCGDVITYTIIMPNSGNITAQNVTFKDTIPNGTVFVANSLTINGATQSGANPQVGVTLPNIAAGATLTVTFQVQVQC